MSSCVPGGRRGSRRCEWGGASGGSAGVGRMTRNPWRRPPPLLLTNLLLVFVPRPSVITVTTDLILPVSKRSPRLTRLPPRRWRLSFHPLLTPSSPPPHPLLTPVYIVQSHNVHRCLVRDLD
eukprot:1190249-Prorocentrum_minimum.AAC.1